MKINKVAYKDVVYSPYGRNVVYINRQSVCRVYSTEIKLPKKQSTLQFTGKIKEFIPYDNYND
jgi:hypothetical protein